MARRRRQGEALHPVRRRLRVARDDAAHRTPDADRAASPARLRRGLPASRSAGRRIVRPGLHRSQPPEAPARDSRTGGRSLPPAIPYPFTPACRHRYPPGPGNVQAVPGINLRVNSQTNIRAQLVKQSYSARQANDLTYLFSVWRPFSCMYLLVSPAVSPQFPAVPRRGGCKAVRPGGRVARGGRRRAGKVGAKGGRRAGKGAVADGKGSRGCPSRITRDSRGNSPNSRRKGVDSPEKGEIASLCTRKYRGEFPREIKIPGNGEKRAHANAGPYSASPSRR